MTKLDDFCAREKKGDHTAGREGSFGDLDPFSVLSQLTPGRLQSINEGKSKIVCREPDFALLNGGRNREKVSMGVQQTKGRGEEEEWGRDL